MRLSGRFFILLALTLTSVSACKSKPAPAPTPVAPPTVSGRPVNQDSIDAARRAADEERAKRAAADAAARDAAMITTVRAELSKTIYFDYDKDEIRDDQRASLDAKVPILNVNPGVRIRIAGHTDSRGSDEYNLALGQRRSAAARRYLVSRGIAEGRIEVVSFGEERPAVQGENEEAWAKNRRDEFEIIAGGETLRAAR